MALSHIFFCISALARRITYVVHISTAASCSSCCFDCGELSDHCGRILVECGGVFPAVNMFKNALLCISCRSNIPSVYFDSGDNRKMVIKLTLKVKNEVKGRGTL